MPENIQIWLGQRIVSYEIFILLSSIIPQSFMKKKRLDQNHLWKKHRFFTFFFHFFHNNPNNSGKNQPTNIPMTVLERGEFQLSIGIHICIFITFCRSTLLHPRWAHFEVPCCTLKSRSGSDFPSVHTLNHPKYPQKISAQTELICGLYINKSEFLRSPLLFLKIPIDTNVKLNDKEPRLSRKP